MADLHEALKSLSPTDWDDLPREGLNEYVKQLVKDSNIICGSVPGPTDDFPVDASLAQTTTPNTAGTAIETKSSNARAPAPSPEHEVLQSHWGKPQKFSAKDNPLNVSVFKMAGRDRHGAWFARRSIHEGIGFAKFRTAMLREFPQTLTVNGGPGEGSIRGIGADQRLERIQVDDTDKVEVYQLSAQFPGPTTPREFITLLVTNEKPTTYASGEQGRQLIIISRPVSHPEAPERSGYIRGQYESVELIREIPRSRAASRSTPDLLSTTDKPVDPKLLRNKTDVNGIATEQMPSDEAELNPVEWIMITRSDPGGGIPRFMVDRGTPSAMLGDLTKFLNWATTVDEKEDPNVDMRQDKETSSPPDVVTSSPTVVAGPDLTKTQPDGASIEPRASNDGGVFHQLTTALEASLDAYAPAMVSSFIHEKLHRQTSFESTSDSSVISSTGSFASATDLGYPITIADGKSIESETLSTKSGARDSTRLSTKDKQHDKEMNKIQEAKDRLEQRLAKKREEEDEKLKKSQNDDQAESSKAIERYNKEIKKQEEKHQKELEKLEAKREREIKKFEEKKRKQNDRDALSKVTRERDDFRTQVDLLKRENALLRERIDNLESINTSG